MKKSDQIKQEYLQLMAQSGETAFNKNSLEKLLKELPMQILSLEENLQANFSKTAELQEQFKVALKEEELENASVKTEEVPGDFVAQSENQTGGITANILV